jgi:DNA-binding winged helix-turn-helix (wHTH) protein
MIINQFLIIYRFPVLFNILDEIKSNLNFNIKHFEKNDFEKNFNQTNYLIISQKKHDIFQNQIKIEEFPINIQKFIEIVNIQFLKNKFNQQNNIKTGKYYINLNSRVMNFENRSLQLTEKEMKIISFLNNSIVPVPISKLQSEVWGYKSKLETHTVETHVYRLRKKVEKKFNDKSFIVSLKNGYKIENEKK